MALKHNRSVEIHVKRLLAGQYGYLIRQWQPCISLLKDIWGKKPDSTRNFGLFSCLKKSQNKKIFLADFDLLHGIGLVERYFRAVFREFFSPKTALFSFFLKKTLLNFCVWERRCFGSPTYIKKKIATAITACIIPKENANCSGAVAIRTKYARGPPLPQTWKK